MQPNGSKLWRYDYRIGTQRRTYAIGQYGPAPLIPLAKARELHEAARASVKRGVHAITGDGRYLFPGRQTDRTMSENTLNVALIALGYKAVHCAHGFRSSASTLLNRERIDGRRRFERSLIELQLDHQDQSVRAYDRDDCLPERVELMQFWADKIDELRDGNATKKTKFSVVV